MSHTLRALALAGLLSGAPAADVEAASNVLFIFDASGSMKKEVDGKSRFAEANLAGQKDENGNPVWMVTEPVTTLSAPKSLAITSSQMGEGYGESSFFIDSVTIDVPEE